MHARECVFAPICFYSMVIARGEGVKLCVTGRCQVMTKRRSSGRSGELTEMEAVVVVVLVVVMVTLRH